jgi:hypothetical protein
MTDLSGLIERAEARLKAITEFGDPYEINEDPEEYGGPDDGLETVCMAYENMQCIAAAALRDIADTMGRQSRKDG